MSNTFNYRVVRVNKEAGVMDVVYSGEGKDSMMVGVPIPKANASLSEHMAAYAPIAHWAEQDAGGLADIQVGTSGSASIEPQQPAPALAPIHQSDVNQDLQRAMIEAAVQRALDSGETV